MYILNFFRDFVHFPVRWKLVFHQIEIAGYQSIPLIVLCVSSAALVTILESAFHMKLIIQTDALVPGFAILLILRELAVVVTCLLLAARVGAGYAAEISQMKHTEQLDALVLGGVNLNDYIVIPRFYGGVISAVLLTIVANFACVLVAMIVSSTHLNTTSNVFWSAARQFVSEKDFYFSLVKGFVFGAIIPLTSCFCGYRSNPGAQGIGMATTRAVVTSSILIIIFDFMLTFVFSFFY